MTTPEDPFALPTTPPSPSGQPAAQRHSESEYGQPAGDQPGYAQPPAGRPAGDQPGYGQPAWDRPAGDQPGYGPPPAAYGSAQGGWNAAPPAGATEGLAIAALVCAIGSFVLFPLVPAVVALVLAGRASDRIRASGGQRSGDGLVTAARVLAWINLALCAVFVLFVLLAVGLLGTAPGFP